MSFIWRSLRMWRKSRKGGHIRKIFEEGEVEKESNLHFLQIANSDKPIACYSLDVIISVGYRVKSKRGVGLSVGQRTDATVVQKSNIGQFTRDGNCPVRIKIL